MTSRTRCLLLLVVLSACGGGSGGDTGTGSGPGSSSSGGPVGSSGPTTGATGSEGSSTSSPTTSGGITGGATGSTSTSGGPGTTSEPLTTGSSTTGTTTDATSSGASSSSGGGGLACVDVSGDYGPCDAILGYGFDGTHCRAFSGCNCAPHCDDFSPDPASCAIECAAAGECNPAALHPAGINKEPVMKGSSCDELDACVVDPESVAWLTNIFGKIECEPANYPCDQGQNCHVLWQGTLDEASWPQVCAASLLPAADLQCVIWGP
ncbi:MAG: hypothetical protein H0T76_04290 [Nannocystis sp.]|nr:hypothetical protein [Nannocystis sp.]MBA3545681.1 hypothetical protein [Nannocystis sp.]